jgi:Protein of unknown function (DUF3501)
MTPLALDDLLPLQEYAARRREFFDAHCRYLDRYRRLRIGPTATLLFENRQTLWFRVQEVLRIARIAEPRYVQQELDHFNRLLPGPGQLQASLLIDVPDETRLVEQLAPWAALAGGQVGFWIGQHSCASKVLTCRPEDRAIGTAHWLQFAFDAAARKLLADPRQPAQLEIALSTYQHKSAFLSEEMRQSLVDDLK